MAKHSKLSPSAAHRWINCPASIELSKNVEDTRSVYAAEGTLAHALAAYVVGEELLSEDNKDKIEKIKKNDLYEPDMNDYVYDYLSYIRSIMDNGVHVKPQIQLENRFVMKSVSSEIFGTADCVIISRNRLDIIDFKYGRNVEVSAVNNEQLRLYAIGAVEFFDGLICDIQDICMHIVQPRMNNISTETLTKDELLAWRDSIIPKAKEALKGDSEPISGDWCKFCRAKSFCRTYSDQFNTDTPITDPRILSFDEIAERIKALDGVATYLKELKEYALSEALKGEKIPGLKVVEGRSVRKWKDQKKAFKHAIEMGVSEDDLYQKKPLSPPQVEKLIGSKKFDEMAQFVVKPTGKPTLVDETDKRKEYTKLQQTQNAFDDEGVVF